jgi:Serine dehydrogenase proteinase
VEANPAELRDNGQREQGPATTSSPDAQAAIPTPDQTPLYSALEQARYTRQNRIRAIEQRSGRRLVCYVAGPGASISSMDIPPFVDLLDDVREGEKLDLLLHSTGGDVDQAERIVMMCRKKIGAGSEFRVIVPDSAKSAATLIAVGADQIVMGYPSDLGPIDPQIDITTINGERMARPAQSFLDGLDEIVDRVGGGALSPAYFPLLDKLDPALIDFCKKALKRSQDLAEQFLRTFSLKDDPEKAKEIAKELNYVEKYLSHGAVIDADRAIAMGLKVSYLEPHDDLWQAYWRLYCLDRLALETPIQRLYEGRRASLQIPPAQ